MRPLFQNLKNQLAWFLSLLLIIPTLFQSVWAFEDCEYANDLLSSAYQLHSEGRSDAEQGHLLKEALRNCPDHAEVHHALASLYEEQQQWQKAIEHYQQAVEKEPNFFEAWYSLGEIFYKQKRFPLSLEAHLHACSIDEDSKARTMELLKDHRYAHLETGEILDKESLLILYDKKRREDIHRLLSSCGLQARLEVKYTFRNFQFDTGKATLKFGAKQLQELAKALRQIEPALIKIHVHTDIQSIQNINIEQSENLNLELSQKRADTIADALARLGVPIISIETYGHGFHKPLVYGLTPAALATNRRIEIEVINQSEEFEEDLLP